MATGVSLRDLFQTLNQEQQDALTDWISGPARDEDNPVEPVRSGDKPGLWVHGMRRAGSSYIGHIAGRMAAQYVYSSDRITALKLVRDTRKVWTQSDLVRNHPDDYSLWLDADSQESRLEKLWNLSLLWIDDLHAESTDIRFWRKHIHPRIEERVKDGKLTIVSTTYIPNDPILGLQTAIEDLFVICDATR